MALPAVDSTSWAARIVRGSFIYQKLLSPPPAPAATLENSALLHALRRAPFALPLLCVVTGVVAAGSALAGFHTLAVLAVATALAMTFPVPALLALPALLIWGPRLNLGAAGDETLFLRLEQAAVAGLLLHGALHPRGQLRSPPGNTAFLAFLLAVAISIPLGILQGTLITPVSSLLYLAQWLEFYGLYVVAWSLGPRLHRRYLYAWAVPLLALAAYGLAEHFWPYYAPPGERYRTFERVLFPGQANHAAGLFALATVSGLGLATHPRYRILGLALALSATLALWPTLSRSGAVAWIAGVGAFLLIRYPILRWWAPPLGFMALAAVPAAWWHRASAPGTSMYDRLVAWKSALSTVDTYPLLGLGAGARHRSFYDNHYIMTLAESGIVGLALLLLLVVALARALGHARARGPLQAGICAGVMAGLAVLGIHALANVTFIITLTAGPFFWYCGVALSQALGRGTDPCALATEYRTCPAQDNAN